MGFLLLESKYILIKYKVKYSLSRLLIAINIYKSIIKNPNKGSYYNRCFQAIKIIISCRSLYHHLLAQNILGSTDPFSIISCVSIFTQVSV